MTTMNVLAQSPHLFATDTVRVAAQRIGSTWEWYVVRAAGFAAVGLLVLLMLSGIGQVTGLTYRFMQPIKAWAVHKAMAIVLCVTIFVHVLFLWLDHFISFSIPQLLVPFLSNYTNHVPVFGVSLGAWAVTFGILAMYGVALIVASSLGWIDSKRGIWRALHYVSYAVMLFAFLHALGVGSDLKYGTFRAAWMFVGFVLVLAVLSRLWRAGTLRKRRER